MSVNVLLKILLQSIVYVLSEVYVKMSVKSSYPVKNCCLSKDRFDRSDDEDNVLVPSVDEENVLVPSDDAENVLVPCDDEDSVLDPSDKEDKVPSAPASMCELPMTRRTRANIPMPQQTCVNFPMLQRTHVISLGTCPPPQTRVHDVRRSR